MPLHATATHGLDKFAIATGLVDDSVEALYFLDFLTGDMRAGRDQSEDRQVQLRSSRATSPPISAAPAGAPAT